MAVKAVVHRGVSIALACRTFQISECCYRYERKLSDEKAEIAEWLVKLTSNRMLNVLDDFNREGLGIKAGFSLPAERVVRSLNRIIEWRGRPLIIRVDNGPEYISGKLMAWAERMGIHIQYIQPGKPQQNAYIERYNRTVRHEWLDQNIFETIEEAQEQATNWLWTYNNDRPNIPFGIYSVNPSGIGPSAGSHPQ